MQFPTSVFQHTVYIYLLSHIFSKLRGTKAFLSSSDYIHVSSMKENKLTMVLFSDQLPDNFYFDLNQK